MKESAHILLIHQDLNEIEGTVSFLRNRGFEVSSLLTCKISSLFKTIDIDKIDLIILDGRLSYSSIFGFLKRLRSMRSTACVLLSGVVSNVNQASALLRAGIFEMLKVPCPLNRLERIIRQGLKNRQKLTCILQLSDRLDSAYKHLEEDRDRLQRWSDDLGRLYTLNQTLSESLAIDEVGQSLAVNLRKIVQYDIACLFLKNGQKVQIHTDQQKSSAFFERVSSDTMRSAQQLLEKGDLPSGPIVRKGGAEILVPLRVATEMIGLLRLIRFSKEVFNDYQSRILAMISTSLSLAIRNAEIHQEVQELASKDELTSLLNRRAFLNVVDREFKRTARYETSLALILIDIDNFKEINDGYGHLVGDQVLREISQLIIKCVRDVDTVARYGGDELVVVLPKTNLQEAMVAAQRIRKKIRTAIFHCADQTVRITISMGIAQCPASLIKTPEDLFRLADQALYAAKKKGRNRIESPPLSAVGARGASQIDGIRR
ncbi:MAG: diguanylate cyclase [Candidatus Manganitrophaceae bacterium]